MNRREALKILGGGLLFLAIPLAFQASAGIYVAPEQLPGSGGLTQQELRKIRVRAFLASCARCHICTLSCPMDALRVSPGFYPMLTPQTKQRCPSIKNCAICLELCPTNALYNAYIYPGGFELDQTPIASKLRAGVLPIDIAPRFG